MNIKLSRSRQIHVIFLQVVQKSRKSLLLFLLNSFSIFKRSFLFVYFFISCLKNNDFLDTKLQCIIQNCTIFLFCVIIYIPRKKNRNRYVFPWLEFVNTTSIFVFQLLAEQKKLDDEMRRQLKLQSEIHADHLREALSVKEQELQRTLQRALCEQADAESIKHKTQLAAVVGRSRALVAALKGEYLSSSYILCERYFLVISYLKVKLNYKAPNSSRWE